MCVECGTQYKGKTGLSLHQRRAHPESYHNVCQVTQKTKPRWSEEELCRLAKAEAKLLLEGTKKTKINSELTRIYPERGLEQIKGQRRTARYKALVEDYLGCLQAESGMDTSENENSGHGASACAQTSSKSSEQNVTDGETTRSTQKGPTGRS